MKLGDTVYWKYEEFDGSGIVECTVSSIEEDHILLKSNDGMTLWIDNEDISDYVFTEKPVLRKRKWVCYYE